MRKMIILYLNYPTMMFFKEYPLYYINEINDMNKYKMYKFIKK